MLVESKNPPVNKKVRVICPICKIDKDIDIPYDVIKDSAQLTTVSIPSNLICQHHFQMFVDKNFKVRGYQKVDFQFQTSRADQNEEDSTRYNEEHEADDELLKDLVFEGNYVEYIPKDFKVPEIISQENDLEEIEIKNIQKKEDRISPEKSLKEIYEEFWEFIDDDNREFREFIIKDKRRLKKY